MRQNAIFPEVKANDTVNNIGYFAERIAEKYPQNNFVFPDIKPNDTLDGNLYNIARLIEQWARA